MNTLKHKLNNNSNLLFNKNILQKNLLITKKLNKTKCNVNPYLIVPIVYGSTRKIMQLKSATIKKYNKNLDIDEYIPILIVDKIIIISLSAFFSLLIWPFYIYQDLRKLELILKKMN